MNSIKKMGWVPALCVVLFLCVSCSDSTDPEGTLPDPTVAEQNVIDGSSALGNELYDISDGVDLQQPSDLDFTAAREHFASAVYNDPANLSGQFGLALTDILNLTANQEINDAFDQWELYLENNTPFLAESGAFSPLGIPLTFVAGNGGLQPPMEIVSHALVLNAQSTFKAADPSIAGIQNIIAYEVIPVLEGAADRLARVAADPNFTFAVTPRMQGDLEAEELEIDQTDVYATRAAVLLLTSVCRLAVTYDVSFSSYDAPGLVDAFDYDTGTFMTLRSDGAAQMAGLETDFEGAVHSIDQAIDALLAEDDNQDNDIIKTDPGSLSEQDLRDFQNNELVDMLALFGEGLDVTADWDDNWQTPDVALSINAHNFAQNPVADWKTVMPRYTLSTELGEDYVGSNWQYYSETRNVNSATAGYSSCSLTYYYNQHQLVDHWSYGNTDMLAVAEQIAAEIIQQWQADGSWSGDGNFYIDCSQYLQAGTDTEVNFWVSSSQTIFDLYVIPVFTWNATTFTQWKSQWNNYNLNGLLPSIDSTDELFTTFGFDETNWFREWRIEWYDLDLYYYY